MTQIQKGRVTINMNASLIFSVITVKKNMNIIAKNVMLGEQRIEKIMSELIKMIIQKVYYCPITRVLE